ncbi:MAG: hypothetical protein K2X38_19285 [Gemmataceae bacterium]|nr:hypothetical protein [Gemmataceae bacterium]
MNAAPGSMFAGLRWTLFRNGVRIALSQSRTRVVTILFCCAVVWGSLFSLCYAGFREARIRFDFPLEGGFIEIIFNLMFLALTTLLIFSTGIILHASLYSSKESEYLLAGPATDDHVFAYKLQSALAFSSWGFLLLGSPILIAYGLALETPAPWHYYALLPLFFLGFVLIPGSIGAVLCILLVNFFPNRRRQILAIVVAAVAAACVAWAIFKLRQVRNPQIAPREWFESLFAQLGFVSHIFVPCSWVTRGLKSAALDQPGSLYWLGLVWSNGLTLYLAAVYAGRLGFRRGFNRLITGGDMRKQAFGTSFLDRIMEACTFFLNRQTQLLILKDFRTFRRDPVQWGQLLIFAGLGSFYFLAMRRFYERDIGYLFRNSVSMLTFVSTCFLMCAYTGRFIYPMLSLEGRKFWILGLLPLDRKRLMWGKFVFAAATCIVPCMLLAGISDLMLGMPWPVVFAHLSMMFGISLGLSGISVGLGALMPNFRETDPSKIAVGFGGTLNLVAGLLFETVAAVIGVLPFHIRLGSSGDAFVGGTPWFLWVCVALGWALCGAAALLPMRWGARHLERMEF